MPYHELNNLPKINNVTLLDNKRFEDLGLVPMTSSDITEIMLEVFGYVL